MLNYKAMIKMLSSGATSGKAIGKFVSASSGAGLKKDYKQTRVKKTVRKLKPRVEKRTVRKLKPKIELKPRKEYKTTKKEKSWFESGTKEKFTSRKQKKTESSPKLRRFL